MGGRGRGALMAAAGRGLRFGRVNWRYVAVLVVGKNT